MNPFYNENLLNGEWHDVLPRYYQLSELIKGKHVLDIGCGSGIGALLLMELGAERVHAIDHRPGVISIARKNHERDGLSFHEMFLEDLEFPDDTFDIVLCLNVETPVTDIHFIEEILRVMKKNGTYVCAIERANLTGFEALLPRYGYASSGERDPAGKPIPQLVNLTENFPTCHSLVQRPILAYRFENEENPNVKEKLSFDEEMPAAVELWYCGNRVKKPKTRDVFLPYYPIAARLQTVVTQAHHPNQDRPFENYDESYQRERQSTSEFRVVSMNEIHSEPPRDDLTSDEPTLVRGLPQSVSNDISELYDKMRNDFQNVVSQAQNALHERDQYISHLVDTIHTWEQRFRVYTAPEPQTTELQVNASEVDIEEDTAKTIERAALSRKKNSKKTNSSASKKPKTTKKKPASKRSSSKKKEK